MLITLKFCRSSIRKSSPLLFGNYFSPKIFQTIGKKQILFKCTKNNKQLSSCIIFPDLFLFFEKLVFDGIYDFLGQTCLLNNNQSGFSSNRSAYTL